MELEQRCPISDTHARVHQAHLLWHQAEREYPNPDGFRVNLNGAITCMRSITFVLHSLTARPLSSQHAGWRLTLPHGGLYG
jgi:hypothetical protein